MERIKVEHIYKQYRLGQVGTGSLSQDVNRWWHKVRGKEDPTLKITESNDPVTHDNSGFIWALKDISFSVNHGEVLGIIGRNGAGKSSLLKILSKVTSPTKGQIMLNGRVASLLEVGTGFHPELTGRENIFLNGAILGMTKREITQKFDEIVAFSGVEKYIDTPVKRYSSGMYVRLAFAVAAHLESEILIVDEVLAVGDAEFQKKCLGKMGEVSKGEGRTVLFVSHNMAAIQKLCNTCVQLDKGKIDFKGNTQLALSHYLSTNKSTISRHDFTTLSSQNKRAFVKGIQVENVLGELLTEIPIGGIWRINIEFRLNEKIKDFIIAVGISDIHEYPICTTWSTPLDLEAGNYRAFFTEENLKFNPGRYKLIIGISEGTNSIDYIDNEVTITFSDVIEFQSESIVNYKSGFLNNQMAILINKEGI